MSAGTAWTAIAEYLFDAEQGQFQSKGWAAERETFHHHSCPTNFRSNKVLLFGQYLFGRYQPLCSKPGDCSRECLVFCCDPFLDSPASLQVSFNTSRIKLTTGGFLCGSFAGAKPQNGQDQKSLHVWFFLLDILIALSRRAMWRTQRAFRGWFVGLCFMNEVVSASPA
ncbi:hypothetical protein [uncultured Roseobacter sp.]|uniref:hypothetical protein n=1 Tax=uncultured Roseobacter sp. TaxID=114847 RepID=UPI00260B6E86|nr:hypothetical protein [uncultured Roseobacter sp.]